MEERDAAVPIVVTGAPDLLLTSVVDALRARGYPAVLVPSPRAATADAAPGVLIVDVDPRCAVRVVDRAAMAGWTVVGLGGEQQRAEAAAAVVAGAAAIVAKDCAFDELVAAVEAASAGALRMSDESREAWHELHRSAQVARAQRAQRLERLSRRETEVLRHLGDGRRAADIAAVLFVSLATVRTHIRSILIKLEVNSQDQAVAAYRDGAH